MFVVVYIIFAILNKVVRRIGLYPLSRTNNLIFLFKPFLISFFIKFKD